MKTSDVKAILEALDEYVKIKVQMELDLQKSNQRGYMEKSKAFGEARSALFDSLLRVDRL